MIGSPDKAEWVELAMGRYEKPLIRYATGITGNADMALDVVQDTFLKLCSADKAKIDGHLPAWLYTVCRNRAFDVCKKEGRMQPLKEGQIESLSNGGPSPAGLAERNEAQAIVLTALKKLPENQQEAFRLKFQDQLTYREISQIMGKSLGTVSNLITSALGTVRKQLQTEMASPFSQEA